MVLEMASDVLKWLCLLLVFLLAFAASFYSIFVGGVNTDLAAAAADAASRAAGLLEQGAEGAEGAEVAEGAVGQLAGAVGRRLHLMADHMHPESMGGGGDEEFMDEACKHLATKYGSNVFKGMKELFEITLGGAESGLECLDELRHPGTSTFVMSLFLISSVVLLLNMLIAMMAKTFDRVFDKQPQVYQYMFAMLTLNWMVADATPPPFNMLRILKGPLVWIARRCAGDSNSAFRSLVDELDDDSPFGNDHDGRENNKDQNVALEVGSRRDYEVEYEVAYDFDGDGKYSALERAHAVAEKVLRFVNEHADEADAMDRWRLRLSKSVGHSERDLGQLSHKVDMLSSNLLTISTQVQAIASALKVTTGVARRPSPPPALSLSPPPHSPEGSRTSPSPEAFRQMRSRPRSPAAVEVVAVAASVARNRDDAGSIPELPTQAAPLPAPP